MGREPVKGATDKVKDAAKDALVKLKFGVATQPAIAVSHAPGIAARLAAQTMRIERLCHSDTSQVPDGSARTTQLCRKKLI